MVVVCKRALKAWLETSLGPVSPFAWRGVACNARELQAAPPSAKISRLSLLDSQANPSHGPLRQPSNEARSKQ
jgi:hypothetical protein